MQTLVHFHTPSPAAKEYLFYPLVGGIFERDREYHVHRKRYDSIMLAFIAEGSLCLRQDGRHYRAEQGEMLLVDCYREHEYYADSCVKFLWLHLDGGTLRPWLRSFIERFGQCIQANAELQALMLSVIEGIGSRESEYHLSQKIHTLMCRISSFAESAEASAAPAVVRQAKDYIETHLEEKLTVREIAKQVHYSPSYFSQVFRQAANVSPYDYLLSRRIERAKSLLLQTELPLELVAARSGFHSVPHFIYAFKKATDQSPHKFRRSGL